MYLHLEFEDGSNPYIFYGKHPGRTTHADCMRELSRWSKRFEIIEQTEMTLVERSSEVSRWSKGYEITEQTESHGGIYVRLRDRQV